MNTSRIGISVIHMYRQIGQALLLSSALAGCGTTFRINQANWGPRIESVGTEESLISSISRNWHEYERLDEQQKTNHEIALAAISQSREAFRLFPNKLKSDKDFLGACFEANPSVYPMIPSPPEGMTDRYNKLASDLSQLGITHGERFINLSIKEIQEIINNRTDLTPDGRRLAVIVFPDKDGNGAFKKPPIAELMGKRYRIVYYEAKQDNDLIQAVTENGQRQKISLLVIGGHGDRTHVAFGGADPVKHLTDDQSLYLDLSDLDKLRPLSAYLKERDSVIILYSCSTGEGMDKETNIANMLKIIFPKSYIYAPTIPVELDSLFFDENNRMDGVSWKARSDDPGAINIPGFGVIKTYMISPH